MACVEGGYLTPASRRQHDGNKTEERPEWRGTSGPSAATCCAARVGGRRASCACSRTTSRTARTRRTSSSTCRSRSAARTGPDFDRIVAALKELEADETLVCNPASRSASSARTPDAPRVVMANGNVVGRWATPTSSSSWSTKGLTVNPGMTAAAWQYIGSQGILQGTYQTFMACARHAFSAATSRGRMDRDRRLRRHGRRAAARRQARRRRHPRGGRRRGQDRAAASRPAIASSSRPISTRRIAM